MARNICPEFQRLKAKWEGLHREAVQSHFQTKDLAPQQAHEFVKEKQRVAAQAQASVTHHRMRCPECKRSNR
jgi:hypothetical protein